MRSSDQERGQRGPGLLDFARRERALQNHWLELKMHLRATRYPMPEQAIRKYLEEKAKFERAMRLLHEEQKQTVASDASRIRTDSVEPAVRAKEVDATAGAGL